MIVTGILLLIACVLLISYFVVNENFVAVVPFAVCLWLLMKIVLNESDEDDYYD